jgi:hypothetical protein
MILTSKHIIFIAISNYLTVKQMIKPRTETNQYSKMKLPAFKTASFFPSILSL